MNPKYEPRILQHSGMKMGYIGTDKGLRQYLFNSINFEKESESYSSFPNLQINIAGKSGRGHAALSNAYSPISDEMRMHKVEDTIDKSVFHYYHDENKLSAQIEIQKTPGAAVLRFVTKVTNESDEEIVLTHVSSAYVQGIGIDGVRPWHDKKKLKLYYCRQTWEGEGQWRSGDLEELGLYPVAVHPNYAAIHFSSVGSWSTSKFIPMGILEDCETGQVWYFQIETSTNWHFEIGCNGPQELSKESIYIHTDAADERHGGWSKRLKPGESYFSVPTAIGCCIGGFDEAVRELAKYKRTLFKSAFGCPGDMPIVFNDYMNCLWGNPTEEALLPLIDAACIAGAEVFCIDAGWFGGRTSSWGIGLGDWEPSQDRFGSGGLQGILDYIRQKDMIPGIWLEVEVCGEDAQLFNKPNEWFITRHGKRVCGAGRCFLNFTNSEVRDYISDVFQQLVQMGVGYVKNDYNACIGTGDDILGSSSAEGMLVNSKAFYSLIDEIRGKYPLLIIENCGSGGMRQDYSALSHFHLQSTSDQEIYYKYPSIINGCLASLLPEQAGIWSYPIPLLFNDLNQPELIQKPSYHKQFEDGEQTIFNMINGMCGNMYLSGHINAADEKNFSLIKEGVELYKKERKHIHNAYPIWPLGFCRINDNKTWTAIGLINEDNNRILLAVWRLGSHDEYYDIVVPHMAGKKVVVRQLFPLAEEYRVEYFYNSEGGKLTLRLPMQYQARYFEISLL